MSLKIENVEYDGPHQCLREALSMVRTGIFRDDPRVSIRGVASNALNHLKSESRRNLGLFDPAQKLQVVMLEAEIHQLRGNFHETAEILQPLWQQLRPKLETWSIQRPLEPTRDRNLLRQKIWVLLTFIHAQQLIVEDDQHKALGGLTRVKDIIDHELCTDKCIPLGPLAKCHYLIGSCYNALGLAGAEQNLLAAQKYASQRFERELARNITATEKRYEIVYKDVFAACVLSVLARVSIHKGQLVRGEHLLYLAQSCLFSTQQDALRLFVESYRWTARRRRLPYSDGDYGLAMEGLQDCVKAYEKVEDTMGEVRCILELARGYLDLAEGGGQPTGGSLARAEGWLKRLRRDSISAKWPTLRNHFLHARLWLLRGDLLRAEEILQEAGRPDAGVPSVAYSLNETVLLLHNVPPRLERAERILEKCLNTLVAKHVGPSAGDVRQDPIYEARCYLLLAKTRLLSKDVPGAQKCLDDWKILSQFVESYFLHHFGETLQREVYQEGPKFERPFDLFDASTKRMVKTIPDALRDYERWLRSVLSHYGIRTKKDLARFYGKHPANIDRGKNRRSTETD